MKFDLQFFAEDALENQTPTELRKGIRSFRKRIAEHLGSVEKVWHIDKRPHRTCGRAAISRDVKYAAQRPPRRRELLCYFLPSVEESRF